MKVQQALIMAAGRGTRLGLGTKSYILYRGKILLEYVIESCVLLGLKRIVVILPSLDVESTLDREKIIRSRLLQKNHPEIKWIQLPKDLGIGFRGAPTLVKKYLGYEKPFFLLCGQSPQSVPFLKNLGNLYKPNSIVLSGYRYRHEFFASIAKIKGRKITEFTDIQCTKVRDFTTKNNEYITHMPYVWTYKYYNEVMKADSLHNWVEFYPAKYMKNGGNCYLLENKNVVSEVDYIKDLPKLYKSTDSLVKNNYNL